MDDDGGHHDHHAHEHRHDASVTSVSLVYAEPFDLAKLSAFLDRYLAVNGDAIFRTKGILSISGDDRFYVLQAVHKLVDLRPDHPWNDESRKSKLVIIGRDIDRDDIDRNLRDCLAK